MSKNLTAEELSRRIRSLRPALTINLRDFFNGCTGYVIDEKRDVRVYVNTDYENDRDHDRALFRFASENDWKIGPNNYSTYDDLAKSVVALIETE